MSKRIGFVQVTIEPWVFRDEHDVLKIKIEVNGRKYEHDRALYPDDINSRLDQLFDIAKIQLKAAINEEIEEEE